MKRFTICLPVIFGVKTDRVSLNYRSVMTRMCCLLITAFENNPMKSIVMSPGAPLAGMSGMLRLQRYSGLFRA